jgi:hypothetical protein
LFKSLSGDKKKAAEEVEGMPAWGEWFPPKKGKGCVLHTAGFLALRLKMDLTPGGDDALRLRVAKRTKEISVRPAKHKRRLSAGDRKGMPLAERIQDNTDEMTECLNHVKELEAKWKDSSENEEKKRLRSDITATSAEIKILSSTLDALLALQGNERDENVGN